MATIVAIPSRGIGIPQTLVKRKKKGSQIKRVGSTDIDAIKINFLSDEAICENDITFGGYLQD